MTGNIDDDEYVANLLEQDAKSARKKYELVGIDAFNPKRLRSGAPKPNTNFLRHIIRQTDSHNSALLAKEAEESYARLRRMDKERQRAEREDKHRRQNSAYNYEEDKDEDMYDSRRRKRQRDGSLESRSRRHRDSSRHTRREKRTKHEDSGEDEAARRSRRSRHDRERRRHSSEEVDGGSRRETTDRRRKRRRSTSRSRSRSPHSARHRRRDRHRHQSRSPRSKSRSRSRSGNRVPLRPTVTSQTDRKRSASPTSDSDPLEAIVGPLPPPAEPIVRSRGRGAHKANSMGIDSRFSTTYDSSIDVRQASDGEDDWGDAVEAFRDRQRWKQQGADRLKAAGFTDDQVKKWSKGDEKSEEDVVWNRTGQAREWDRGKVLDEDGHVDVKAEWGRLK